MNSNILPVTYDISISERGKRATEAALRLYEAGHPADAVPAEQPVEDRYEVELKSSSVTVEQDIKREKVLASRPWLKPWNSETARAANAKRWEYASISARRGMADAGRNLQGVGAQPYAVVRYLAEQHTLNAADPSAPGSVQSFREVMRVAYPSPDRSAGSAPVAPDGLRVELGADLARELLAELRARRSG